MQCNKPVVCLPAGRQTLYFFPFGLLVYDSTGIGAIPYDKLNVRSGNTSFREVDSVPGDATVVGHTWRYVNKNGGPDRRFSNNAQLPILNYGVLNLTSDSGLNEMFQTSRASAATAVEAAVHAMPQITFAIRRTP